MQQTAVLLVYNIQHSYFTFSLLQFGPNILINILLSSTSSKGTQVSPLLARGKIRYYKFEVYLKQIVDHKQTSHNGSSRTYFGLAFGP
jgi:hypothetical protein